jgi:ribonuclease PH
VLDLDYAEDSNADADANFVLTGQGGIVEVQGTAERAAFSEDTFLRMLGLARHGIEQLVVLQKQAIGA